MCFGSRNLLCLRDHTYSEIKRSMKQNKNLEKKMTSQPNCMKQCCDKSVSYSLVLSFFILFLVLYCSLLFLSPEKDTQSLNETEIMQYIVKKQFPTVDIILLPPFIMGIQEPPTNYSVLSVMRFAPWIRRMHICDRWNNRDLKKKHVNEWDNTKLARIVQFSDSLLDYVLSSPYLSEHFLILCPNFVLTNYCFSWQFFVSNTIVLKPCKTGLVAMTRTCFNECCYVFPRDTELYEKCIRYAYQQAFRVATLFYKHNRDHFISPCSSAKIKNTKKITNFQEQAVQQLFKFEEKIKDRQKPIKLVLCVIGDAQDVLQCHLPAKYVEYVQIWIYVLTNATDAERLSFLHQMLSMKNVFIEVDSSKFPVNRSETMGAYIMKEIHAFSKQHEFKVLEVFALKRQPLCHILAEKLGKTYQAPTSLFVEQDSTDTSPEYERLSML